ncbi:MAG TPA: hypothetical protein VIG99_10760 [Myxococcaceae bacterium]|jgi:hypothetical protein
MPLEVTFFHLPCGARCARLNARGIISEEEAVAYLKRVDTPEGDIQGMPVLTCAHEVESVTPGARRLFATRNAEDPWGAMVITNPVLRVAFNFLLRVRGSAKLKLFTAEPEALKWLDDRVREELAARPPE